MKKLLIAFVLLISFVSCGNSKTATNDTIDSTEVIADSVVLDSVDTIVVDSVK